ncbi:uncharacterized protein LOC130674928 [Microplitis mediator]|uniref:uncharacterized protein LOC130674928 n=1 Tax=Microplitis mediator TaxID=375433 RepID=UPI0025538C1C|nr:uncharacterized protein LOC130674928 [Microplitis mediator]
MQDNKEGNISVITIDAKLNWKKYEYDSNLIVFPSYPTVILSADSLKGECFEGFSLKCFSHGIAHIKYQFEASNYWSSTTTFLVTGNQCSDAWKALEWLWTQQISSSYFLCPNEFDNNTIIYTMNPFGDRAPEPWEKIETLDKPCDVCTFYKMSFINDTEICSRVTFDKAEFLNGYKLSESFTENKRFRKTEIFYKNLWSAMNITPVDFLSEALLGHLQISTSNSEVFDTSIKGSDNVIPYFEQGGYIIVTQKQTFIPTLDRSSY